ncbi:hypothetical protein [Polyangium mundeleinium]|uniref:RsbT co-antagonist protein RsbRD N-terminal domain-containing protein n=1 Tax=Polyangium mundeleinium TaxID=2995306 RepID=A0ABT5F1E1_9BACT|nr:hypothetical protein [Polyangium mundeleinium]MDC0747905.1 hypothetical protein [Polyangium mundeleinium]
MSMKGETTEKLDLDELFARWSDQMAVLDAALVIPKIEPLVPGTAPGRPVSEEWKAEMRKRTDLLHPLAREMAEVYLHRLDDAGRRRAQALLAAHRRVVWQFDGVIDDYLERFLQSLDQADLDIALALTAIYDAPAGGRDFHRVIYPRYLEMQRRGIDARALFEAALPLTTRHDDPDFGAHGLFLRLGRRLDDDTES